MNILFINYEYPPIGGGAAQASRSLARSIRTLGHTVVILTSSYKIFRGYTVEDGISVYRVRSFRPRAYMSGISEMISFMLAGSLAVSQIARRHNIDSTVAFFTIPCGPIAWILKRARSLPFIVSLRGGDVPGFVPGLWPMHLITGPIRRRVLKASNGIVANSKSLAELSLKADPYPVSMIPNGVDTDFFRPGSRNGSLLRILSVGRLHHQKNIEFLLDQLDLFYREDRLPFELHIAGEGPESERLKAHSDRLAVRDMVIWHGWCDREKVRTLYQTAGCLVSASLYEGMSNVLLEGMACGLPVIASRVSGNSDLIEDGRTGLLFDLQTPTDFLCALRKLAGNPALAANLGRNARSVVEKDHSWHKTARRYLEILGQK